MDSATVISPREYIQHSNVCECGVVLPRYSATRMNTHKKTKTHEQYMKYKHLIVDGKITCTTCNAELRAISYEEHLKSYKHIMKTNPDVVNPKILEDIRIKAEAKLNKKLGVYNANKDISNCCVRCMAVNIDGRYFIPLLNLCMCCDEIIKGGNKRCTSCKEMKDINLFERLYLHRCKLCASTRKYYLRDYRKSKLI